MAQEPAGGRLCVVCAETFSAEVETCPNDGAELVVASAGRDDGSVLGMVVGSYRLIREIGSGAVGTVWEAEHVRLGRKMALKILDPEVANDEAVKRFFNEARAVNEIQHPNIIEIEDFVSEDGTTYLLMELLEGRDLRQAIVDEGKLSPDRVAHIGSQVADALAAAADVDIVHRDLKPDNIFLVERDGDPDFIKLLDFGIAKFTKEEGVTQAGMTIGTPEYMAPEQITLKDEIDTRGDIYSLGVVLYEALTGEPPFLSKSRTDILRAHLDQAPVPPSERLSVPPPPGLEAAVMKCLEKKREDRFQNVRELKAALDAGAALPKARELAASQGRERRLPRLAILLAALGVALLGASLFYAEELGLPLRWPGSAGDAPIQAAPAAPPAPGARKKAMAPPIDAAAEQQMMQLTLQSKPEGAHIFVGESREPVGYAPRDLEVPIAAEPLVLCAQFPDGVEVTETVVPDRARATLVFVKPGWTEPDASPSGAP